MSSTIGQRQCDSPAPVSQAPLRSTRTSAAYAASRLNGLESDAPPQRLRALRLLVRLTDTLPADGSIPAVTATASAVLELTTCSGSIIISNR